MSKRTYLLPLGLISSIVAAESASAIALGQIDDFQDGTTQGWAVGNPATIPPVNSTDNGPLGIGDHALLLGTTGAQGGPSSRLAAFNTLQWSGDYTTEGVTQITLDARNLSGRDVTVRLAADGGGGRIATVTGHTLPANSGWQPLTFDIAPADWTAVGGFDIAATLSAVGELRIVDSAAPSFRGDVGAGELLIDNIQAAPEPGTVGLMLLGSFGLLRRRRSSC